MKQLTIFPLQGICIKDRIDRHRKKSSHFYLGVSSSDSYKILLKFDLTKLRHCLYNIFEVTLAIYYNNRTSCPLQSCQEIYLGVVDCNSDIRNYVPTNISSCIYPNTEFSYLTFNLTSLFHRLMRNGIDHPEFLLYSDGISSSLCEFDSLTDDNPPLLTVDYKEDIKPFVCRIPCSIYVEPTEVFDPIELTELTDATVAAEPAELSEPAELPDSAEATGPLGLNGTSEAIGTSEPLGLAGTAGTIGTAGLLGLAGTAGTIGTAGPLGLAGTAGPLCPTDDTGPIGPTGCIT